MSYTNDFEARALNYASSTLSDLIGNMSEFYEAVNLFKLMSEESELPVSLSAIGEVLSMTEVSIRVLSGELSGVQHLIRTRKLREESEKAFASIKKRSKAGAVPMIGLSSQEK